MKYLKKLLDELENVMDQVETELQRRVEETPGERRTIPFIFFIIYFTRQVPLKFSSLEQHIYRKDKTEENTVAS